MYERLFVFLVQRLNYAISSPEYRNIKIETILQEKNRFSIDLLDIFGFEVFKKNSFEQFCINFANEKLQQLYITYVFKSEIDQFILEGLKAHLNELKFKDNQTLIDLIDSQPLGIFSLLNESSSVASTDEALLNIITKNHKNNENLKIPKGSKENFIIIHTAKDVEYNITNFRTKNKDEISNDLEEIMGLSTFKTISCIYLGINHFGNNSFFFKYFFLKYYCFKENVDELVSEESDESEKEEKIVITNSPTTKVKFLSAKFRKQMNDLMSELNSCEVHFIRCIKPNEEKKKNYFVPLLALNQIRYLGVLESIKIRKESYPIRRLYRHFFEKYYELDDLFSKNSFLKHCDKKTDFIEATKKLKIFILLINLFKKTH